VKEIARYAARSTGLVPAHVASILRRRLAVRRRRREGGRRDQDPCLGARSRPLKPSETLALAARARELKAQGHSVNLLRGRGARLRYARRRTRGGDRGDPRGAHALHRGQRRAGAAPGISENLKRENGLEYKPSQIVVSNGAKHAIWNAFPDAPRAGGRGVVPVPYWVTFRRLARFVGGTPVFVPARPEASRSGPRS